MGYKTSERFDGRTECTMLSMANSARLVGNPRAMSATHIVILKSLPQVRQVSIAAIWSAITDASEIQLTLS